MACSGHCCVNAHLSISLELAAKRLALLLANTSSSFSDILQNARHPKGDTPEHHEPRGVASSSEEP